MSRTLVPMVLLAKRREDGSLPALPLNVVDGSWSCITVAQRFGWEAFGDQKRRLIQRNVAVASITQKNAAPLDAFEARMMKRRLTMTSPERQHIELARC